MKKPKPKPEPQYNPYELDPPEECWLCGAVLDDFRKVKRYLGHRVCRECPKVEGVQDEPYYGR